MSLTALDPQECTRCRRQITADDPNRPEQLSSHLYAPVQPRPTMPGGTEVHWQIAADYEQRGSIAALLCQCCTEELADWLYRANPGAPREGDRVRLTYGDGSSVEGTWRAVLERDDGHLHTHTRGQVRRDVLTRVGAR